VVAPVPAAQVGTDSGTGELASAVLAGLTVRGRGPMTGYSREAFGQSWADVDRNGCDTRNDMLSRDLTAIAYKPGTGDCLVLSGQLAGPYTATPSPKAAPPKSTSTTLSRSATPGSAEAPPCHRTRGRRWPTTR
jgi:hypothetical protein